MSAPRDATAPPLSQSLIGTWKLLSREDRNTAGEQRIDPLLGADPIALLVYDRGGHFAAQFMKRDRSAATSAGAVGAAGATGSMSSTVAGTNNTRARDGYDAYFGSYAVDDAAGTVTQRLMGSLAAENVGLVLTRGMTVEGDELIIRLDTTATDGEPITRTLRWRRVG